MYFPGFKLTIAWICILLSFGALAQQQVPLSIYAGLTVSAPSAEMRNKFDRANGIPAGINSVGFLFDPGYKTGKSPVKVGMETNWFRMGVQKHDPAGDLDETKSKSRYNGLNLVIRLEPVKFSSKWRPFLDVLGGAGIFTTTTRVDYGLIGDIIGFVDNDDDILENENIGKFWDASFQQGIAIGVRSQPAEGKLGLQARVVYMRGQAVEVSKASDVVVSSSDQIAYNPSLVSPGHISIQLGVQLGLKR